MEKPDVHSPKYWLRELRPLLNEIHFAFQAALPSALKYFDEYKKKPINGPVLSNLIRYEVLEYLKGRGISAREEEDLAAGPLDDCGMNALPNNGIELTYRGSCIRLRKGTEAPMPTTETQRGWYQQIFPFEECTNGDGSVRSTFTNLLILWCSKDHRTFSGLKLLRTNGVGIKSVLYDWEVPVDAPVIPMSTTVESEYKNDSDLPLHDTDEESGTGTDGN